MIAWSHFPQYVRMSFMNGGFPISSVVQNVCDALPQLKLQPYSPESLLYELAALKDVIFAQLDISESAGAIT